MPDLKPCPFCGGRAGQPEFYAESKTARFIACGTCGANVYRALPGEDDAVLVEAWNRRAGSRQLKEMLTPAPDKRFEMSNRATHSDDMSKMRGLEPRGKNHSTVRACQKVENRKVPRWTTGSANGDGCLGSVQDRPASQL